jgi:hypothetical protein
MKTQIIFLLALSCVLFTTKSIAQVAIGETYGTPGTMLDVVSATQGVLFPRIALTATNVQAPVKGTLTSRTVIYNTDNSGSGTTEVDPGFYVWNDTFWKRLSVDAFKLEFNEGATTVVNGTSFTNLDNLTQDVSIIFTGKYQIMVNVYYNGRFPGTGGIGGIDSALA